MNVLALSTVLLLHPPCLQLRMLQYKHTAYVFANIVLLLVYACWFGQQSIRRYLDDAVYIIQQEEKPATINPPGIYDMMLE